MSGLRRLFRGSGRALAFVFAASVVWLLLDMAALRLSLGEAGGRLLKEAAGRGRERLLRGPQPPGDSPRPHLAALRRRGGGTRVPREPPRPPTPPPAGPGEGGQRGRGAEQLPAAPPGARLAPPGSAVSVRGGAGAAAAPAVSRAPRKAAEEFVPGPAGSRAGLQEAPPARGEAPRSPPEPPSPAPGRPEPAQGAGVGAKGAQGPGHAAPGSPQRAASTAGPPPRAAGPAALRGQEQTDVRKKETSSENHFILISKEAITPAIPHPGSHSAGNFTNRQEKHKEQQLTNKNDDARAVNTVPWLVRDGGSQTRGATPGAAPELPAAGRDGQGQAGGSPGTHRVLSVDVTLAPRDPQAPGQFGHPVAVPDDKQEEAKSRWKEGNFNVYLSDLIPVDRAIADTRPAG